MRKTWPKTRGKRSVCSISSERFTKETPEKKQEIEKCDTKGEGSKDTLCL
jgi:hypothetical protein